MYTQLIQPNLNTVGTVGSCESYARRMFGAPGGILTAWLEWQKVRYRHNDANLPTDAAVPMWYSYIVNGVNQGHVTINVPGKGIYSSPYKLGTTHAVLSSVADVERIYGVKYVGWSEDINGLRVAQPQGDSMNQQQVTDLLMAIGKLGMLPESVFTSQEWLSPRVGSAMADPAYLTQVAAGLANSDPWKTGNYKAVHYDADVQAAQAGSANATTLKPGTYVVQ